MSKYLIVDKLYVCPKCNNDWCALILNISKARDTWRQRGEKCINCGYEVIAHVSIDDNNESLIIINNLVYNFLYKII